MIFSDRYRELENMGITLDILSSLNLIIIVLDPFGNFVWVNEEFEKNIGYSLDEIKDKPIFEILILPEQADEIKQVFQNIANSNPNDIEFKEYENYWLTKEGNRRIFQFNNSIVLKENKLKYVLSSAKDITERVRKDRYIRKMKKMEGIERMAAILGHDLKNYLTPLLLEIQLVREKLHDDKFVDTLETYLENVQTLSEKLMQISNPRQNQLENIYPENIIENMMPIFEKLGNNIKFKTKYSAILSIKGDASSFRLLISNLVINAIQAVEAKGEGEISIHLGLFMKLGEAYSSNIELCNEFIHLFDFMEHDNKQYAVLRISDNGVGIPNTMREKIFEPFVSTKEDGNGLGLTSVYKAVQEFDGKIGFISEENIGTTFYILIPTHEIVEHVDQVKNIIF
ncbi:MAG: PAS domain S-box protein [Candidatus Heimdallarchaeota archaeon]|nr:PAS domain S-box protein [Candidatus Heimdallarchaeota archaeon]